MALFASSRLAGRVAVYGNRTCALPNLTVFRVPSHARKADALRMTGAQAITTVAGLGKWHAYATTSECHKQIFSSLACAKQLPLNRRVGWDKPLTLSYLLISALVSRNLVARSAIESRGCGCGQNKSQQGADAWTSS